MLTIFADFAPLVHLNSTNETIAVFDDESEILIDEIRIVNCSTSHVNKRVLIFIEILARIDGLACPAALFDHLGKVDHFALILPKQNERKWNAQETEDELSEPESVVIFDIPTSFFLGFLLHLE